MNDDYPSAPNSAPNGELTLKQGGFMLLGLAAFLGGLDYVSIHGIITSHPGFGERWSAGGIPVTAFWILFAVLGLPLAVIGVVKKR